MLLVMMSMPMMWEKSVVYTNKRESGNEKEK